MTSSFTRFLDHTQRRTSSGRVISSSQRPLPDNTQHSQHTDFHAPGGIRTHDLSRRAAADLRLRPRGHWDRLCSFLYLPKIIWLVILCNGAHSLCSISDVGSGNLIFFSRFSERICSSPHFLFNNKLGILSPEGKRPPHKVDNSRSIYYRSQECVEFCLHSSTTCIGVMLC